MSTAEQPEINSHKSKADAKELVKVWAQEDVLGRLSVSLCWMVAGNMIISIKYSKGTDVQEFAFVILAGIPIKDFQIHDMGERTQSTDRGELAFLAKSSSSSSSLFNNINIGSFVMQVVQRLLSIDSGEDICLFFALPTSFNPSHLRYVPRSPLMCSELYMSCGGRKTQLWNFGGAHQVNVFFIYLLTFLVSPSGVGLWARNRIRVGCKKTRHYSL